MDFSLYYRFLVLKDFLYLLYNNNNNNNTLFQLKSNELHNEL